MNKTYNLSSEQTVDEYLQQFGISGVTEKDIFSFIEELKQLKSKRKQQGGQVGGMIIGWVRVGTGRLVSVSSPLVNIAIDAAAGAAGAAMLPGATGATIVAGGVIGAAPAVAVGLGVVIIKGLYDYFQSESISSVGSCVGTIVNGMCQTAGGKSEFDIFSKRVADEMSHFFDPCSFNIIASHISYVSATTQKEQIQHKDVAYFIHMMTYALENEINPITNQVNKKQMIQNNSSNDPSNNNPQVSVGGKKSKRKTRKHKRRQT